MAAFKGVHLSVQETRSQLLRPESLSELFSLWNRFPAAVPYAGGTALMRRYSDPGERGAFQKQPELPEEILSLEKLDELHGITRTERYLEIGAMVRLGEIIALGKIVPGALSQTILGIEYPLVRNMATIGGMICSAGDAVAPLCALDAVYELRNAGGSRWISAFRYSTLNEKFQPGELLTRIRIPLEEWNYTIYRKFNLTASGSGKEGGVLILVVQNQKNILTAINVIFSGTSGGSTEAQGLGDTGKPLLRDKDSEAFLEGKALPLDRRNAAHYRKFWEAYLDTLEYPEPPLRDKILNAIEAGVADLST